MATLYRPDLMVCLSSCLSRMSGCEALVPRLRLLVLIKVCSRDSRAPSIAGKSFCTTPNLSSDTLAATTFVMTSIAQMAVWALHSTDRTPWSAVVWKRVERSGLDFNASSLAETRECRLEGAALAGVNSSTLGGRVGARRRIGVLVAAGTGAGEGGGGADFGEITEVIDMEMSLTASRQASLSRFQV